MNFMELLSNKWAALAEWFLYFKNEATAIPFIESLQLFTLAESLGGVESLVEVPLSWLMRLFQKKNVKRLA